MFNLLCRVSAFGALLALLACSGGGGTGPSKTQSVTLQVTSTTLPDGTVSAPYQQTLTETGGVAPFSWTIASGSLPNGLSLSSTGVIRGTPTLAGSFSFTVSVTDAGGNTGSAILTIGIFGAGTASLHITTTTLPNARIAVPYQQLVTASGGTPLYIWMPIGSLPTNMSLSADGVISGTPTQTGQFTINLQVTDALGQTTVGSLTLTITQ